MLHTQKAEGVLAALSRTHMITGRAVVHSRGEPRGSASQQRNERCDHFENTTAKPNITPCDVAYFPAHFDVAKHSDHLYC